MKIVKIVAKNIIKSVKIESKFHGNDFILDGISYQELVDTVHSNEKNINVKTVKKTFLDLLERRRNDAFASLMGNMRHILTELKSGNGE